MAFCVAGSFVLSNFLTMLHKLALITAAALAFFSQSAQGAAITSREDVTREVYVRKLL